MSWPYLHVLLNHFPIVLTVIGALATFLGLMQQRRGTWVYALTTLTLAGVSVYPAWATGQRASRMLRGAWYIVPESVHRHSQAADIALWTIGATGLVSLIALITVVRTREAVSPAAFFRVLVGLLSVVSIGVVAYTGYLGGEIVVQSPILSSPTPPAALPAVTPGATIPAQTGAATGALPAPPGTTQPAPTTTQPVTLPAATPQPANTVPAPTTANPAAGTTAPHP